MKALSFLVLKEGEVKFSGSKNDLVVIKILKYGLKTVLLDERLMKKVFQAWSH